MSYLTEDQLDTIFEKTGMADDDRETFDEYVAEAIGEMEVRLSKRFVVPLVGATAPVYTAAPKHSRNYVSRLLKLLIAKVVAMEEQTNSEVSEGEAYYNKKSKRAKELVEMLLNPKLDYGFKLSPHAQGYNPVECVGLARPDTEFKVEL